MQYNSEEFIKELIKERDYETKRKKVEKVKMVSYPVYLVGLAGLYSLAAMQIIDYNKPFLLGVSVVTSLFALSNVILYINEKIKNVKTIKEKENNLNNIIRYEIDCKCDSLYSQAGLENEENKIKYLRERLKLYNDYNVINKDDIISTEKKLETLNDEQTRTLMK